MADLSNFKKIINMLKKLGFNDFYQAGTTNEIHELNLIVKNPIQDRQYWIKKSFGEFVVIYRNEINDSKKKQYRFKCKNQKQVCDKFQELIAQ